MLSVTTNEGKQKWKNWSGDVECEPAQLSTPQSIEEIQALLKKCESEGRQVRVVGSGHSFSPLVQTNDMMISLDGLQGIIHHDVERAEAEVWAGTKLYTLGEELAARGFAQENLGDINAQSIAGAVSTGTHGTGVQFGSLSTQVKTVTLLTATGEEKTFSTTENASLLPAAQLSLGSLGVITKLTLALLPKYCLRYQSERVLLQDCLARLDEYNQNHRHFEFYWFPYTKWVQIKTMDQTDEAPTGTTLWNQFNKTVVENGLFWLVSECSRLFPRTSRSVSKLSARGVPVLHEVNESHRLFASPRLVRFHEMEYSIPANRLPEVMEEIEVCVEKHRFAVHFPLECRYVKADNIWLSPAYGRDSAFIAVHMYKGMPYKEYFAALEEIFLRHEGRPHWGKMHTQSAEELKNRYPKWEEFMRVREELDPAGLFLNPYLRRVFGVEMREKISTHMDG
ncbi:D-arabinono-1,4-lactone oxidase [Mechercharimyces sp. CAU 1602]|uniref:D-arabinono-1,4-lactone oxidase n=1 Tax=Mechercharimyces sp. CAU 1602 TaxID=2973933 RepID=UPI002163E068|nr:D-arabinono-1,4-lactone oxidase [Mechercharimyces sp. CAU 1602]MCS1350826.1 FAD-binding protein [Mechercharimyces sp. CAU 1602]